MGFLLTGMCGISAYLFLKYPGNVDKSEEWEIPEVRPNNVNKIMDEKLQNPDDAVFKINLKLCTR